MANQTQSAEKGSGRSTTGGQHAVPGPHHERFAKLVGDWDTTMTMWFPDPQNPVTTTGRARYDTILGGLYLAITYTGTAMGRPFNGRGITGYDVARKQYCHTWCDDMSSTIQYKTGNFIDDGKTLVMHGEIADASSPEPIKMRDVLTHFDDDHERYESFVTLGGNEMKAMEVDYRKVKR
jgi:hypothetical protein